MSGGIIKRVVESNNIEGMKKALEEVLVKENSVVIVALVNPKSGGKIGSQLLSQFKEILPNNQVYDLKDEQNPGPTKALEDWKDVDNVRLVGK